MNYKKILISLIVIFVFMLTSCDININDDNNNFIDILNLDGKSYNILDSSRQESNRKKIKVTSINKNSNLINMNQENNSDEDKEQEPHEHVYDNGYCECGEHQCIKLGDSCLICGKHLHDYSDGYCMCGDHMHEYEEGYCIYCYEKHPDHFLENIIKDGQYVLVYKSNQEFSFTVTLKNPKAESIDAIEIYCNDPNALILVDGEWRPLSYQESVNGLKTRIVNWSQEDPYQKTFYIKTSSGSEINKLKIVDIKVNGKWQRKELTNDIMNIYKMDESQLVWEFVNNNIYTGYKWKFNTGERISNLVVYADDKELFPDENGIYSVKKDSTIRWQFDYDIDNLKAKMVDKRDIEPILIVDTYNSYYSSNLSLVEGHQEVKLKSLKYTYSPDYDGRFFFKIVKGTDVDLKNIEVKFYNSFDEEISDFIVYEALENHAPGYYGHEVYVFSYAEIKIGNFIYRYTYENLFLNIYTMHVGDDSIYLE